MVLVRSSRLYGPFEVLEKVGDNSYKLNRPPYMRIFIVVNVDNLKLYEPSMLDQDEDQVLPSIEELLSDAHTKFLEDTDLENWSRTTI
jgi:hypothetical protein